MAKTIVDDNITKKLNSLSPDAQKDTFGRKASAQLLVLSRRQVPFDDSDLSQSGFADKDSDGYFVAYTEEYAAYQHEGMRADGTHVVRNWSNGRKSKYLEDPLKENIDEWRDMAGDAMKEELRKKL